MIPEFDDTRLDDPEVLASHDEQLRQLAGTGARIRIEAADADLAAGATDVKPRGVVVVGAEARLVRAVLEPVCPVPLVAWSLPGLPGWVGALDLVVVLASRQDDSSSALLATVAQAARRGCLLLVAAPAGSAVADAASSRTTLLVPTRTGDVMAAAVVVCSLLNRLGLAPEVNPEHAAEAADMVAEVSSPHRDLSSNPAKDLACGLGDADPLVWGGSVLAARAARRIAEALRLHSGRHALSADAGEMAQVMRHVRPRDPFADPFTDDVQRRPALVLLDDQTSDVAAGQTSELRSLAEAKSVRVCELEAGSGTEVDRYVTLLMQGLYGATYLGIGLGTDEGARP
ncbi:hypothetical protein GCM10009785_04180 [Brooklawnia cerclae]|uniref:Bifunctional glucose-6-phosphate/mannose-6-phosphate isomerase C-terminal domain-containing protein n=1 Tax=Brooklawnia cerclae TaxID=349934 RepID=A0ABX0SHB2_9ACTN|nr:SIS domain-containing protein [Brooklawnia cerclae]NIH55991.1 hypothetical protein [Brooklawnia cerclae]